MAVISERAPERAQGRMVGFTQVMWMTGILVTLSLGFALSTTGLTGARVIFGWMAVAAIVTWALRSFNADIRSLEAEVHSSSETETALPLRALLGSKLMIAALVLTGTYYIVWGLLANTFGQFQTYFLVTVSGPRRLSRPGCAMRRSWSGWCSLCCT